MNNELQILELADYHEKFTVNDCTAYLIINKKIGRLCQKMSKYKVSKNVKWGGVFK